MPAETIAARRTRALARVAAAKGGDHVPLTRPAPAAGTCAHLGAKIPGQPCGSQLFRCDLHDCLTTRFVKCDRAQRHCATCPDFRQAGDPAGARWDETSLYPGLPGKRFNASLVAWGDGYAFCWRDGWAGSNLWACRLDRDLRPAGDAVRLDLPHPAAAYGREDPRLFVHADTLHVAFVGVEGRGGRVTRTSQLYAALGPDFRAGRAFAPRAPGVPPARWEKNWQFFSHAGELYAVYSAAPHRVLKVDGDRAAWAYEEPAALGWAGGEVRGGAAPVRVGDEFWCFFHDRLEGPVRTYRMGLYAFDADPPFAPTRIVPTPLLAADHATRPADQYAAVVFPCGAARHGADWVVSLGVHDRWTELRRFRHADLEARLKPLPGFRPTCRAVPAGEAVPADAVLAAFFVRGASPWGVSVGGGRRPAADLSPGELGRYLGAFARTCEAWGLRGYLLHDGLPEESYRGLASPRVRFKRVPVGRADRGPYERRWFALRDWLRAHPEVARAWLVDAGDVAFTADPFAHLDSLPPGAIAVNQEPTPYRENPWFVENLAPLPPALRDPFLTGRYAADLPLNCGAWGGPAKGVLAALEGVCRTLEALGGDPNPAADTAAVALELLSGRHGPVVPFPRFSGPPLVHAAA